LETDKQIKEAFRRIFVENTKLGGSLAGVNAQELLRDLASITDLRGFPSALRTIRSTSRARAAGILREIRVAAADRRPPNLGGNGWVVEDIDLHIQTSKGKSDIDVLSNGTLWQLKTGKNPHTIAGGWVELDTWTEKAVEAARKLDKTKVGFRFDAVAEHTWHFNEWFQQRLPGLKQRYPGIDFVVGDFPSIPVP
jgi:hypothetical protein